ncbi:MAG: carbohydrate ABC transporter permease [Anaerolineae bacterium]|nr:carbohydrate ABC transporter permease [Anaerolineae bacterium]
MSTANPSQNRSFRLPRISFASVGSNGMLIIYAIIVLLPLFIVVTNTMRPTREIYRVPVALPASINFDSYVIAWNEADFSTYFMNSLVITVSSVVLGTSVSALAAYILGRYNFPGGRILSSFFVAGLTLPFRLAIVPLFLLLNSLGLIDNRLGLILVYAATGIPFSVFILSSFFRQLPQELTEAARIDGAQEFTIFGRVMLPLVRPALATVAIFQFVPLWNDFFFPLVLLRSTDKWTLPVGMTRFFGEFQTDWSTLFAGLVITTLPLIILFLSATEQIITGLTAGVRK